MTSQVGIKPQNFEIRPLTCALGAEIYGLDVRNLDKATFDSVYQAFLDYSVLVFRDQELTEQDLGDFGRRFGKLEDEPFLPNKTETPGVYFFRGAPKNAKTLSTQNLGWHMDHSYQKNPSKGAMLYATEIPPVGGDTLFASNYDAYEGLSDKMKAVVEDSIAIHDVLQYGLNSGHHSITTPKAIELLVKMRKAYPQTEHPLVCKHPETGRKMLYINNGWVTGIKDLHNNESQALLAMLKAHALKDIYQCRVRWQEKSLLLWDNRCVQHSPNSDYTGARRMLRVALHGDWEPGS